jgi:tripartite-type tricarboxylate transporter receptor subunit TctC
MRCNLVARAVTAVALAAAVFGAQAQDWPHKPVRVINPFPAGGGVDTFARPIAAKLSQALNANFYVENMGGAGGTVGAAAAARQPGDGYTVFMGAIHHAIAESLYTKLTYGIEKDFEPVTVVAAVPNVIVVHPKLTTINKYDDFVKYLKANPGKLNFGSAGNGTSHHLIGELYKMRTGTDIVHVPYKGAGPMMSDLLAGNVDMAFDGMGTSANQIKAGKLKPLAVTSGTRNPVLPDTPTLRELGLQDFDVTSWYAMWVPKGTPKPIVDKLYAEVLKILAQPDIKALWDSQGATAPAMPPAEFARFQRAEIERWGKVVRDAKIKIDN